MKSYIFTAVILLLVAFQKLRGDQPDIPACVQQKIDEIKKQRRWNPPAEVQEYFFKGRRVFYFSSNCCDQFNVVVDEQCNYICAPSGGTTGRGDGKCSDFITKAQYIKQVWKDERSAGQ